MKTKTLLLIALTVIFSACKKGPKVITKTVPVTQETNKNSGIFDGSNTSNPNQASTSNLSDNIHSVTVKKVLEAEKYLYLYVSENNHDFWIASRKLPVNIGETYFYKRALLKTNFESKEHNKVFDTIYLVSSLVKANHGMNTGSNMASRSKNNGVDYKNDSNKSKDPIKITPQEGSISIAKLVDNKKQYEGKTVQITGKCTKINPKIMNRNWIHLKDGSKDDFDLVVTSDEFVPEGSQVTMKATVTLDKDFGAGYKYDLILENGQIIK